MTTFRIFTYLLAALFLAVVSPSGANAGISGEAELGYVQFDAEQNGKKIVDAHSFHQRYSLIYSNGGTLYGGRVGSYDVSLGYEWGSFDTKIKNPSNPGDRDTNVNPSISTGHLIYQGEIVIDPLELPLKLKAYSQDMSRIALQEDTIVPGGSTLLRPGLMTNLVDGTHISTGATLLFGVKNGLTNGYNAIFRHIPLVMLDYRDELNRDLKSQSPMDTRMRRLAFVSLNKRDNWFHYRTTNYDDYINREQSFKESQLQIGTIDQALSRRWIDLTNWIKISTDGQFTKHATPLPATSFQSYELNLFSIASRQSWEARNFSSFTRVLDAQGLSLERTIPVYANGVWGADTDWKAGFFSREKRLKTPDGNETTTSDVYGTLRIDTLKRSLFTLSPSLKMEHMEADANKTLSMEAGIETRSSRRFSSTYSLSGSYNVRYFASENPVRTANYVNHDLTASVAYAPMSNLRFEFAENITAATGTNPQDFSGSAINPNSELGGGHAIGAGLYSNFVRRDNTINEYVRYVTNMSASWTPIPRATITLSLAEDILTRPDAPDDYLTTARNTIDYSISSFLIRLKNSYNIKYVGGEKTDFIESQGTIEYKPSRAMEASLNYIISDGQLDANTRSTFVDLKQKYAYNFFTFKGVMRKLLEVSEEFDYTETRNNGTFTNTTQTAKAFTLGARYFPMSRLFLAATARYSILDPGSITEQVYNASMGMTFQKLQATLDYSYGKRNGTDNRVEKRISANLKKLF